MKYWLGILVVLGLAGAGYYFWKHAPSKTDPSGGSQRPTSATVESRNIRFAVNAAGDIGPADQVSVRPEVNGRIAELPVDIGDKISKDALLCRLDDKDLQIERSQRVTEIDGAQLQLQKARRNFARSQQLFADRLVSQELFEDTKTEHDLATNALERAQSALRMVEDRLSKTKILAPFDCTVLTRPVSTGQAVSGSAGFNSGTEVMTVANLNDMIINVHVNQADVTRLTTGQIVDISVESVPGLAMKGTVERIAPQATIKNSIKGFAARILIKNIDPRVRPGMTSNIKIPVASADNVVAVPLAAVFSEKNPKTQQMERFVYVMEDEESYERRTIAIGVSDYQFAEVQNGLTAGEVVSLVQPPSESKAKSPPSTAVERPSKPAGTRSGGAKVSGARTSLAPNPVGVASR